MFHSYMKICVGCNLSSYLFIITGASGQLSLSTPVLALRFFLTFQVSVKQGDQIAGHSEFQKHKVVMTSQKNECEIPLPIYANYEWDLMLSLFEIVAEV